MKIIGLIALVLSLLPFETGAQTKKPASIAELDKTGFISRLSEGR